MIAGGTNVNSFSVINLENYCEMGLGKNLPGAVYDMDVASVLRREKEGKQYFIKVLKGLPPIIFCAKKNLYQVKFSNQTENKQIFDYFR